MPSARSRSRLGRDVLAELRLDLLRVGQVAGGDDPLVEDGLAPPVLGILSFQAAFSNSSWTGATAGSFGELNDPTNTRLEVRSW